LLLWTTQGFKVNHAQALNHENCASFYQNLKSPYILHTNATFIKFGIMMKWLHKLGMEGGKGAS
jgi:hypothetical protein